MTLSIENIPEPAPIHPVDLNSLKPVATAIDFLVAAAEAGAQPGLEETARRCGLSQAHFQKMFRAGAGISPKRFLQYLTAGRAVSALSTGAPVLDAAFEAGLSAPSRLHDLMVHAEAMPPGSIRRRGAGETIRWARVPGPFGRALIGVTTRGICWLSFETVDPDRGLREMKETWPAANFIEDETAIAGPAEQAFAFATGRSDLRFQVREQLGPERTGLDLVVLVAGVAGDHFELDVLTLGRRGRGVAAHDDRECLEEAGVAVSASTLDVRERLGQHLLFRERALGLETARERHGLVCDRGEGVGLLHHRRLGALGVGPDEHEVVGRDDQRQDGGRRDQDPCREAQVQAPLLDVTHGCAPD